MTYKQALNTLTANALAVLQNLSKGQLLRIKVASDKYVFNVNYISSTVIALVNIIISNNK